MQKEYSSSRQLVIAVSACLLGEPVRYDGGDKRNQTVLESLGKDYQLLPICPEVGAGLGVPRPPVQLVLRHGEIRALGVADAGLDVTTVLNGYASQVVEQLVGVAGFVFKSRSPSCGLGSTPILQDDGAINHGHGLFACAIVTTMPQLPVIDEESLEQPFLRQRFLQQVALYGRRLEADD